MFRKLTDKKIKKIHDLAISAHDTERTWEILQPLIKAQTFHRAAADALINIIKNGHLTVEQSFDLLSKIFEAHHNNDDIVILIGTAMEASRDTNNLNAGPPKGHLFSEVIKRLSELALQTRGSDKEVLVIQGLSCTARLMARQHDDIAEKSYKRLVELLPDASWTHYNQGLYFKTRGRFFEGVISNQNAIALTKDPCESYQWNLGICATGSGQGAIALNVWKEIGQKIKLGRFDLPEGTYPSCKVRLAERPLSQRFADHDDPGLEETIWIERLSPCHGIIRSVLFQNLGVDYGDVILFDGAPITYHKYGDQQIAVFPHLSTLKKSNYQFFDFAGTQNTEGELGDISASLDKDAVIYSHTENYRVLCSACWNDETIDHEHKDSRAMHVVTGRIAVPADIKAKDILDKIDKTLKDKPGCTIFSPDLCRASGLVDRAKFEKKKYNLLRTTNPTEN